MPRLGPRSRGRLRRAVIITALTFLTAYTGVFFKLNDRTLGRLISYEVTKSVRGTFTIGRAHYDYFGGLWSILTNRPTHVRGGDFEMIDPDGNVVMRVPHVEADMHLRELIASLAHFGISRHFHVRLHFAEANVESGFAVIAPTRSTFGTQKPEMNIVATMSSKKPGTDDQSELSIQVDKLDVGPIDFALASSNPLGQLSWIGRIEGVRGIAQLSYSSSKKLASADGPAFFFALREIVVPSGELRLGDFVFPLRELKGRYFGTVPAAETGAFARFPSVGAPDGYGPRQTISFAANGQSLQGEVKVVGALLDPYGNHGGVQLRLEVEHAAGLATLLPQPIASWISGDPHGSVTIQGPFSDIAVSGDLEGALVDLVGLPITHAGGRFTLGDRGTLQLRQLHGDIARGHVAGSVDVQLEGAGAWRADVEATGVDPALLPPMPPSLREVVGGRLTGRLRLSGSFGRASASNAVAIDVQRATLERNAHDFLPKHVDVDGKLVWDAGRLGPIVVKMKGDGLDVDAAGSVTVDGTPSASLDFTLGATPGPWLDRVGLPRDLQVGHAVLKGHVGGPLLSIDGNAHFDAENIVVRGRHIGTLNGDLSLSHGEITVSSFVGEGLGAKLAGNASFHLFEVDKSGRTLLTKRLREPTLDAKLRADGAQLAEVFGTPLVAGASDLDVALHGPIDHPNGHAAITVPDLKLIGDAYTNGKLAFDFSDEGAKVSALHLERVGGGRLDGAGKLGWQGQLDLTLDPKSFPLVAIPGVSTLPVAVAGTISGKVHLGGELQNLSPSGVISLVGAKIRDTVFGDGSLKLEPGADAIHITGKFFQSYTVDGYLTLFPKISIAVTVKFDDIELERIFPEIRKLADVRGRATGEARITADADAGLTFAGLRLGQLSLVLSGLDETGRARRLVVRNVDDVTLSTNGRELAIDHCSLRSALGAFSIQGRVSQKDTDVELKGHIGLELLEYFFASLFQRMSGDAAADLHVRGDLTMRPTLLGSLELHRATLQPRGLEGHRVFVPSGGLRFDEGGVHLQSLRMELDGATVQASGSIALVGFTPGKVEGDVVGDLSPKLLQWALPDQIDDASGKVGTNVHFGGTWQHPEWHGKMEVKNARVSLRRTGRELVINTGTAKLDNYDIVVGCEGGNNSDCKAVTGMIDDESRFSVEGRVGFGDKLSLRTLTVHAEANDLSYNGGDFAVRASPAIDIRGDGQRLELTGLVNIVEGRFTRNYDPIDLIFKPQRSVERPEPFWSGIPLLEQMKVNVTAKTSGPFAVRNNIADLTFTADLSVGGTLAEPTLGGEVSVEQGGNVNLPFCRFPFVTNRSQLTFDPAKSYPDTPSLQISATGVLVSDRTDASQNINILIFGTPGAPQYTLTTQQGLQGTDVITMCVTGQTADELRRGASPGTSGTAPRASSGIGSVQSQSTTEGVARSATGVAIQSALDPLRKIVRLDTFNLEFGTTGVDVKACKRWTRGLKTCGTGEIGFVGGSRVGGYLEYKILDQLSVLGRGEYLTRGVETEQDALTRGRLELNLRIPLLW